MDSTHDPALESWVESANGEGVAFPIQNLPYGVARGDDGRRSIVVAIGDMALDLRVCVERGLLELRSDETRMALSAGVLNPLMSLGPIEWREARHAISSLLSADEARMRDDADARSAGLRPAAELDLVLPASIGDYTDFYASLHHATNVGSMFRPDNPLMPNYKHLPVGYHGRASTIVVSGTPIHRPSGQTMADGADLPTYGPCRLLDYELELGIFTGGANALGEPITMDRVGDHLFGMCIVNDWSARDVQKWEYQPLGPFNAKNFATSISPWVVTFDALAPFRIPGPPRGADDPPIIDYLQPRADFGLDITVEVLLSSAQMRESGAEPMRVSLGSFSDMFWTVAQMLAHHTSTGCTMRPGDLLASGTISGPDDAMRGCLLERTWRGTKPLDLPDGTQRKFLQDGDEVIIRAWADGHGARPIGFGACAGVVG